MAYPSHSFICGPQQHFRFARAIAVGLALLAVALLPYWLIQLEQPPFPPSRITAGSPATTGADSIATASRPNASLRTQFVPAYSHIYMGDGATFRLTVTLSVRNSDPNSAMIVHSVRYYDTDGKLVRKFLDQPVKLGPLATREYLVQEKDVAGGSGANFLVDWSSESLQINVPLIEAVMIGVANQQGISFTSRGVELMPRVPPEDPIGEMPALKPPIPQ